MAKAYRGLDVQGDLGGQFPWKSRMVDVGDGVMQAVVDEGPKDAPITFVCCHGNPTWGFLYRRFVRELSPRHRVVAVDDVGFGRSDKPRDPSYYTLERHIQNLSKTLDALGVQNAVPVVQDWGGPIGLGWATRHPERVKGVVVLNTWAFVKGEGSFDLPWLFKRLVLGKGGWKRSVNSNIFTELFLVRGTKLSREVADAYRAAHPTPEDRVGIARFPQLIPERSRPEHESYATMAAIEDGLAKLADKPALLVWAMKDRAFGKPQLLRWQSTFRSLDGPHRLPNASHYLQEDGADELLAHVKRWSGAL
jgi:haloalkane dehalogenase